MKRQRSANWTRHGLTSIRFWSIVAVIVAGIALWSMQSAAQTKNNSKSTTVGLPKIDYPGGKAPNKEMIALGQQLFFDRRLSIDKSISCASCHDPAKGWSNGTRFATGVGGKVGGRSAPTIVNSAYNRMNFWDGRASTLEDQALGPIQNPIEMTMKLPDLERRLNAIPGYRQQFMRVFGTKVTSRNIAKAIAAYERTILSGDAPYDRYKAGDKKALSAAAERGMKLFHGKAHCSACHNPPLFTDNSFHNVGIGMDRKDHDKGRVLISKLEGDTGAFKTPQLREIARTAPYMHDGSFKTLKEVVEYYNKGGNKNPYLDEEIYPLKLTSQEISDVIHFLKEGLSSPHYPMHKAPQLPK